MSDKTNRKHKIIGANRTEAWQDHYKTDPDTEVVLPTEEGVEEAKNWVDEHEV